MKYIFLFLFLAACSAYQKTEEPFLIVTTGNEEWVHYEGQWLSGDGKVYLELSLKTGVPGSDAEYMLYESFSTERLSAGTSTRSTYSTFHNRASGNAFGLVLYNLTPSGIKSFFRYRKSEDLPEEMFFITRGQDELIPCNNEFEPLTTDSRYTLHRRSDLITVEGYVTFDSGSVDFFERNTRKRYKVADLAEFYSLQTGYKKWAKVEYEGVYVKALAYTIADSTATDNKALVIKRLILLGSETEDDFADVSMSGPEDNPDVIVHKPN
ncbi:MAG: hypothetical protein KIT62_10860 [Cyclobacteriaceae bacterium]|nr:hypothetical protein [Cyclobacteriaceae bacterium]